MSEETPPAVPEKLYIDVLGRQCELAIPNPVQLAAVISLIRTLGQEPDADTQINALRRVTQFLRSLLANEADREAFDDELFAGAITDEIAVGMVAQVVELTKSQQPVKPAKAAKSRRAAGHKK